MGVPGKVQPDRRVWWVWWALFWAAEGLDFTPGETPPPNSVPLIQALVDGDLDAAHALIDGGADVNAYDVITPLYAAQEYVKSSRQRHRLMRRLIKLGSEVDQQTKDNSTVLMLAAQLGDFRSVEMLLDAGANPLLQNEQGYSALAVARFSGNDDITDQIQEYLGESGLRMATARGPEARDEL